MTGRRESVGALVACAIVAAIYLLRLDGYAGLTVDDAWYMVLGKALASGEGFRLVSSSATPIVPVVPPGFPALLSIVFVVSPSYPGNLLLLKAVSLLAMAGVGVACWIDYTRHRDVQPAPAILLIVATLLIPSFVFLSTSTVMAEASFTLAQMLTVIAIERTSRRDPHDGRAPVAAGLVAAATMLIRTAGLAIVAAGVGYLLLQRRWRQASIFAIVAALSMVPWLLYANANASPFEERMAHGGTISHTYRELLVAERPELVTAPISPTRMLWRAGRNIGDIVTRDVGAVILPVLYRGPSESGEEVHSVGRPGRGSMGGAMGTLIVSAFLCLLMLAGIAATRAWFSLPVLLIAASVLMISSVGSQTIRYVVPLAPFLLLFLWRGIRHQTAARIAVLSVIGFQLMDHALYLQLKTTGTPVWIGEAAEADEALSWMTDNITGEGAIASSNPGLVYLRTGRKGVASASPEENWENWKRGGVRYVAALRRIRMPSPRLNYRILFQSKSGLWVVEM